MNAGGTFEGSGPRRAKETQGRRTCAQPYEKMRKGRGGGTKGHWGLRGIGKLLQEEGVGERPQ